MFFKIIKTLAFKIFNTWLNANVMVFFLKDRVSTYFYECFFSCNFVLLIYSSIFFFRIIQQKLFYNISFKETIGDFIIGARDFKK